MPVVAAPHLRDRLREYLALHRIYCSVHWPLESVTGAAGSAELKLSRSMLTLPVDQGLDNTALYYLFEKINDFMKGEIDVEPDLHRSRSRR